MVNHCGTYPTPKWKCLKGAPEDSQDTSNKMPKSRCALDGWCKKKHIKDIFLKEKLTFMHSILQLPDQAAPRQVLLACLSSTSPRSWINTLQRHLNTLNLPDISTLAANTPSADIWCRCIDKLIACQAQLNLLEEAESKKELDPLIRCCTKPSVPAPHWKVTHSAKMLPLTTKSNFRVRLPPRLSWVGE